MRCLWSDGLRQESLTSRVLRGSVNSLALKKSACLPRPARPSLRFLFVQKLAEILGHASSAIALYAQPPDEVDQDGDSPGSLASVLEAYYSGVDARRTSQTFPNA